MADDLFVRSVKITNNISRIRSCLASCTEQFPLTAQIIFQEKQMLRALTYANY